MENSESKHTPRTDEPTRMVIFHRAEGWYPIVTHDADDLAHHASLNPGTIRISDMEGNTLWPTN